MPKLRAEIDYRFDHSRIFRIGCYIPNETAIDFETRDGIALEEAERGETRAIIVEGQPEAEGPEC